MAHAEKCPICYGTGQVNPDPVGTAVNLKTCHGCGGTGWVTVQDNDAPIYFPPKVEDSSCGKFP